MIYNYLSLPLAIGIVLFDLTPSISKNVPEPINREFQIVVSSSTSLSKTQANNQDSGYLGLMNAGYAANEKKDYLKALEYFQQALKIQPQDSTAQKAIANISKYSFDRYMQEGYAADRIRDYALALQHFQKALQIKPDSWYARQAVVNINSYLAQQPVVTDNSENQENDGFSLLLFVLGIGAVLVIFGGVLFYLFNKTGNSTQNLEPEKLEPLDSFSPAHKDEDIETETQTNFVASEPQNASVSEQTKQPITTVTDSDRDEITTISPHQNLAKLDIVPELIQDLDKGDRSIRKKAVWELAQRGDSRAMKPLVELMVEADSQERGLILEAMTQIAGRTLKPMNKAIMMSLEDENSQVKQNAIRDLTRVYDLMSQVTKRLSLAVEDSDAQVQDTAKWALKKLNQIPASSWQMNEINTKVNGTNVASTDGNQNIESDRQHPLNQEN